MEEKIVEGLWDCPYCNTKGIGGLAKHCPECGHPQDKDISFYMGEKKYYLSEDEARTIGDAPDWVCDYCSSLNNAKYIYCSNCGAKREKETKDYFENKEEKSAENEKEEYLQCPSPVKQDASTFDDTKTEADSLSSEDTPRFPLKIFFSAAGIGLLISVAIIGLVALFSPKYVSATVTEKEWEREVDIEEYRTVMESGWSIPSGGRLKYSQEEIRSYESVLDHYETRTRTTTEQVLDGYDTNTSYSDNGNGTFTEHTTQTPRYRTETKIETYEEPVYIQVPVYDTKYYYEIERWKYNRTESAANTDEFPYWPEYELEDNERVLDEDESYTVTFTDEESNSYTYNCDYEEWQGYVLSEEVDLKLSAGLIIEVLKNNESVLNTEETE